MKLISWMERAIPHRAEILGHREHWTQDKNAEAFGGCIYGSGKAGRPGTHDNKVAHLRLVNSDIILP
jgi:hypothetical protein